MPFLDGRLDVAAQLLTSGKVKALLISGDAQGGSATRSASCGTIWRARASIRPGWSSTRDGPDTYDTCRRAHDVYGVTKALLVSQELHLHRAVTLCRRLGVDAYGVPALCEGCQQVTIWYNTARDVAAGPKAAWEALRHRQATVVSPPDPALLEAAH